MLQKRHYELIVRVLARSRPGRLDDMRMIEQWRLTVRLFADMLTNDNPRFSRAWFENACQEGEMDRPPNVARRERDRPEFKEVQAAFAKKQAEKEKRRQARNPHTQRLTPNLEPLEIIAQIRESLKRGL